MSAMQTHAGPTPHAPPIELSQVLQVLGDELDSLGRTAERLQTMLSPLFLRLSLDPVCRRDAQACDQLTQHLYGLSAFVMALLPSISQAWQVDPKPAGQAVPLSDLAGRLACMAPHESDHESGELEMF
jgi:hypothetical protein